VALARRKWQSLWRAAGPDHRLHGRVGGQRTASSGFSSHRKEAQGASGGWCYGTGCRRSPAYKWRLKQSAMTKAPGRLQHPAQRVKDAGALAEVHLDRLPGEFVDLKPHAFRADPAAPDDVHGAPHHHTNFLEECEMDLIELDAPQPSLDAQPAQAAESGAAPLPTGPQGPGEPRGGHLDSLLAYLDSIPVQTNLWVFPALSVELYECSGVKTSQNRWMRRWIRKFGLQEGIDFDKGPYFLPNSRRRRVGFVLNLMPAYAIADRIRNPDGRLRAREYLSQFRLEDNLVSPQSFYYDFRP
jgi:hypothetical protein